MFAVVKTGGKQYRVEEGRTLKIDRIAGEPGDSVELGDVLAIGEGADVRIGAPTVAGARVIGTIAEQGRAPKIVVFRYKNKTRSRKKTGHRQQFTRVVIHDVLLPGQEPKPREERRRPAEADSSADVEVVAAAEPAAAGSPEAAPVAEDATAAPKRGRRKAAPAGEAASEKPADAPPEEKPKRSRRKSTES